MRGKCLRILSSLLLLALLLTSTYAAAEPARTGTTVREQTGSMRSPGLPTGELRDGFYVVRGIIYAVQQGEQLRTRGTYTIEGMETECFDSGVCRVKGDILTDVFGTRYALRNGRIYTKPGILEIGDDLYCVRLDGTLLCGGVWRTMQFDETGKYTSGNEEIDAYVDGILEKILKPGMTKEEKLWACYCYVYGSMEYRGNNNHVPFGQNCAGWSEMYMLRLIEQGKGNCYCFASEMYYLARRIGYCQARAISGQIGDGKRADHGWLEISINGVRYVFDPELDVKRCETLGDIFKKSYTDTPWAYWRP